MKIELSESNSSQRPLNDRLTNAQQSKVNKSKVNKNKYDEIDEAEKYEELNQILLHAQVAKDKKNKQLENLSQANLQNQILD